MATSFPALAPNSGTRMAITRRAQPEDVSPHDRDTRGGAAKGRSESGGPGGALAPSLFCNVNLGQLCPLGFFICAMIIGFSTPGWRVD